MERVRRQHPSHGAGGVLPGDEHEGCRAPGGECSQLREHLSLRERRPTRRLELRRLAAVDPGADGDNGVEAVELDLTRHFAGALGLNYPTFSDSCQLV